MSNGPCSQGVNRPHRSVFIAMAVVCAVLGCLFVVPVSADDAPDDPASFYGSATDENGDAIPSGTTLVAAVDGETADSIEVEPAGEYGGEGAFEEKLRIDSGQGDEVTFRLEDADGPIGGIAELTPGVFEEPLVFPAETDGSGDGSDPPNAAATVEPTEAATGENITFSASESTAAEGATIDGYEWTLERDGDEVETFDRESIERSLERSGTYNLSLRVIDSEGRTDSDAVTFGIGTGSGGGGSDGGGSSGSGGGGGGGGGGVAPSGSGGGSSGSGVGAGTDNVSTDIVAEAHVEIDDVDPDSPGTTVAFEGTTITEITFDTDSVAGTVSVRESDALSEAVPPLPGDLRIVSASIVTVPSANRETSATLKAVVDPGWLRENHIIAERIEVYRLPSGGDEWEPLPAEIAEAGGEVLVTAETPGFSRFVLAAPETPELLGSEPTSERATENPEADSEPEPGLIDRLSISSVLEAVGIGRPTAALLALLATAAVIGWIFIPRRRR